MSRFSLQACWLLAILSAYPCAGQIRELGGLEASPHVAVGARRTVSGTVTNSVTGEPIRRALVQVSGQGQFTGFTGADGRFQIEGVPEGQATVAAEKPGFFGVQSQNTMVTIGAGTNDVHVNLIPEAKISGRIVDEEGEPVEGMQVYLLAKQFQQGHKNLGMRGAATTDEDGVYVFDSLPRGSYLLHLAGRSVPPSVWNAPLECYPPRYYPGVPDLSSAQALSLEPGQDSRADFTLSTEHAFRITGNIVGLAQNLGLGFSLEDGDGQQVNFERTQIDQATGKFVLAPVPAGAWTVALNANAQGTFYAARQEIVVSGSDVQGLQILPQPSGTIPVSINHASASSSEPAVQQSGVQLQLLPAESNRNERYVAQQLNPSPAPQENTQQPLVFPNVPPGKYKFIAETWGTECLASAFSGNADLTREALIVTAGSAVQPVVVNLRSDCATLNVTLHSDAKEANAWVIVTSEAAGPEPKVVPIAAGTTTVTGLSPGGYRVYALSNVDDLEYANPDALSSYPNQQIDLSAGQKASVTVEAAVRNGN
jgi:hypothetical protein